MDKVKFGNIEFLVIDLNKRLSLDTEVYPGDPKPKRKIFSKISDSGYEHYLHEIGDHNFQPHADAPKHQIKSMQNKGIEFFDKFGYIFNKAILIDLSNSPGAKEYNGTKYLLEVKKEHLKNYSENIDNAGAILIRTGYDKFLKQNKKHSPRYIPFINEEGAKFIESFKNLKVIGIDSLSIDSFNSHFAHELFTKDKLVVESIAGLYKLKNYSSKEFLLMTKPVTINGSSGGPVIAFAFIEE